MDNRYPKYFTQRHNVRERGGEREGEEREKRDRERDRENALSLTHTQIQNLLPFSPTCIAIIGA